MSDRMCIYFEMQSEECNFADASVSIVSCKIAITFTRRGMSDSQTNAIICNADGRRSDVRKAYHVISALF